MGSVLNLGRLLETSFYKGGLLPSWVIMPYNYLRNLFNSKQLKLMYFPCGDDLNKLFTLNLIWGTLPLKRWTLARGVLKRGCKLQKPMPCTTYLSELLQWLMMVLLPSIS